MYMCIHMYIYNLTREKNVRRLSLKGIKTPLLYCMW